MQSNGRDNTRKVNVKLYFHCGPLEKKKNINNEREDHLVSYILAGKVFLNYA